MLTSVHSYSGLANVNWGPPPGLLAKQCLDHHHDDCYVQGHAQPDIYSRPRFEATPQMGDWAPGSYESTRFTIGDEPSEQRQWTADLGSVPKDCYYCKGSGDCPQDDPTQGKGKDYMGQKCNSCSGSGKCYHCDGDGVIG